MFRQINHSRAASAIQLHALLHHQFSLVRHQVAALHLLADDLQQVQRADGALDRRFQAGQNAGGVEEVEAEERGDFFSVFDVVVADGTLPDFAVVNRLQQVRQQLLYILTALLKRQPHVYDALVEQASPGWQLELPEHSRDDIRLALMTDELELRLLHVELIIAALQSAGHPTPDDLHLIPSPDQVQLAGRVLHPDPVAIALYGDIELRGEDNDCAVGHLHSFLDDSALLEGQSLVLGKGLDVHLGSNNYNQIFILAFYFYLQLPTAARFICSTGGCGVSWKETRIYVSWGFGVI